MKLRNKESGEVLEIAFYGAPVEEKVSEDKFKTLEQHALCLYVIIDGTHYAYRTIKEFLADWEEA